MEGWTCDYVKKQFPGSRIRQEGGQSDVNGILMNSDWTQKQEPFYGATQFPEGAPRVRPFYWDIAKASQDEVERQWGSNPVAVVQKLIKESAVPYWLPKQDARQMGSSSEMWFHPKGAGAPAHMDPHCKTTVSFCFSGQRRWRMMVPPPEPHPEGYFDGQIYGVQNPSRRGEWEPTFSFDAPAGSAVIVYPGMVHETLSTGEECSSSISQTFSVPVAAAYFRAFWPRFSRIGEDVGQCGYMVEHMVTLGSGMRVPPSSEKDAKKVAIRFIAKGDKDGNGKLSDGEIRAVNRERDQRYEERSLEELVSFHDVNDDGVVTTDEVVDSWIMYATAEDMRAPQDRDQDALDGGDGGDGGDGDDEM